MASRCGAIEAPLQKVRGRMRPFGRIARAAHAVCRDCGIGAPMIDVRKGPKFDNLPRAGVFCHAA